MFCRDSDGDVRCQNDDGGAVTIVTAEIFRSFEDILRDDEFSV